MDDGKANIQKNVQPEPDGKGIDVQIVDPAANYDPKPSAPPPPAPDTYLHSFRSRRTNNWDFIKISEVILRVGTGMLSLMAFSVMVAATDKRHKVGNQVPITIKFSDFQAYKYLIGINVLAVMYSVVQLIMLGRAQTQGYFYSATFNWILATFICDQLMGYLLFSASSSAATASELSRSGVDGLWLSICSHWELNSFCIKVEGAVGLSFFASFFVVTAPLISGYHIAKHI